MGVSSHLLFVFILIKISRHWVGKYLTNIFILRRPLPLPRLHPPPPLLPRHLKIPILVKRERKKFCLKITCDPCFLLDHFNWLFVIEKVSKKYCVIICLLVKEKSSGHICWVCHSQELSSYTTLGHCSLPTWREAD